MQNLTFEDLCGLLREEFGSAAVSSPQHPRVGDGDPVTGDLILREEGASSFMVGAQDRGQWSELGRFPSEAEACDFILRQVRHSHRPGQDDSRRKGGIRARHSRLRRGVATHSGAVTESLDDAVVAYVWRPSSSLPGKHADAVRDPALRARVEEIIAELDAIRPGADAIDLMPWADREARAVAVGHPELGEPGIKALRDLLSWTWR